MRARDYAEERGLARAIGADKAADLLFRDVEADVIQRGYATKVLGQLLDFQNTHVYSLAGTPASLALPCWSGKSRKSRRSSPSRPSGSNKIMIINSAP